MDTLFDGAGFIFAFRVLPAIIFVTALVSILYHRCDGSNSYSRRYLPESIKYQQDRVIRRGHWIIFLGQNEIPAIVKPFIDRLNRMNYLQRFVVAWPRLLVRQ